MNERSPNTCWGCGAELTPPRGPGRPKKWCSERCRKGSYGDPCADCGARTSFGAQEARVPYPRCQACAHKQQTKAARERQTHIESLWACGMTMREIGFLVGCTTESVGQYITRKRAEGANFPYRRSDRL